jgi:hypothetical protein
MRRVLSLCGAMLLATLVMVSSATAQIPTGVVDGQVVDVEGLPLPGVLVEISGPDLMGTRTAYTGTNGSYRFPAMPRGEEYAVTFSMSGFKTVVRERLIVRLNTTTTIDVTLELTGIEETITVTGESPVVDVRSTNVGVNVTSDHMQNVPNARDVWVVLEEVPSMVMDRFNVGGFGNLFPVRCVRRGAGVDVGAQGRGGSTRRLPQHRHPIGQQCISRIAGLLLAGAGPASQQHRR